MFLPLIALTALLGSCEKKEINENDLYGNGSHTIVPDSIQGNWMYGNFSMTEYWEQNPDSYIGNAFEMAIAFTFNANGTYDHYFTSKTVSGGNTTYHQSVTKGTIEVNEALKTITTHAISAHYKRTQNGITVENRDLEQSEITQTTTYTYELLTEANGTQALYLKLNGTGNALQLLKQP